MATLIIIGGDILLYKTKKSQHMNLFMGGAKYALQRQRQYHPNPRCRYDGLWQRLQIQFDNFGRVVTTELKIQNVLKVEVWIASQKNKTR